MNKEQVVQDIVDYQYCVKPQEAQDSYENKQNAIDVVSIDVQNNLDDIIREFENEVENNEVDGTLDMWGEIYETCKSPDVILEELKQLKQGKVEEAVTGDFRQRYKDIKLMDQACRSINDEDYVDIWLSEGCPDESTQEDYEDIASDDEEYERIFKLFKSLMKDAVEDGLYKCPVDAYEYAKQFEPELKNLGMEKYTESKDSEIYDNEYSNLELYIYLTSYTGWSPEDMGFSSEKEFKNIVKEETEAINILYTEDPIDSEYYPPMSSVSYPAVISGKVKLILNDGREFVGDADKDGPLALMEDVVQLARMTEVTKDDKLQESSEESNFISDMKNIKNNLYDYVANNYYKLGKEELKELALNAIYVAENDAQIVAEILERNELVEEDYTQANVTNTGKVSVFGEKDKKEESNNYYLDTLGVNPYDVNYEKNPKALEILNKFKANNKLESLFDYLASGVTEPFENEITYLSYVAGTDIEDYEQYNGKLEESKTDDAVETRIKQAKEWKKKLSSIKGDEAEVQLEELVDEILEKIKYIKDNNFAGEDLYSGMEDVLDDEDARDRGPATYVRSVKVNMRNILDDFINNYKQAYEEENLTESASKNLDKITKAVKYLIDADRDYYEELIDMYNITNGGSLLRRAYNDGDSEGLEDTLKELNINDKEAEEVFQKIYKQLTESKEVKTESPEDYSKPVKVDGKWFRYNYKYSEVEYITHESNEFGPVEVIDSVGLSKENWENKEERETYLQDWSRQLDDQVASEVDTEEFSNLFPSKLSGINKQFTYEHCSYNEPNEYRYMFTTEEDMNKAKQVLEQYGKVLEVDPDDYKEYEDDLSKISNCLVVRFNDGVLK